MQNYQFLTKKLLQIKRDIYLLKMNWKKWKSFDLGYFIGKSHFDEDRAQNYLVFQPILSYFTLKSTWITKWKSEGLSNESLEVVSKTSNTLTVSVNYYGEKVRLRFTRSVFQQKNSYIQSFKSCKSLCSLWNNRSSQNR